MEDINAILSQLVQGLLLVLIPVVIALVKLGFDQLLAYLNAKAGSERLRLAIRLARVAVQAAEQVGLASTVKGSLLDKKQLAVTYLNRSLLAKGIALNFPEIEALIESQVMEQFNWRKTDPDELANASATLDLT